MTLYFTPPFSRMVRRHLVEPDYNMMESEIVFPVDVKVEADGYVLTALLPGIRPEDLNIQITDGTITLQGELRLERGENEQYLLKERPSGRFYRTLTLPDPLDSNQADANLELGVLTLRIPKAEQARPKTIKVISK